MIVSWNWLKEYVRLDMPAAELERRLMLAGLNHEETKKVGNDLAIDLEVTSNRPDCLGHIGRRARSGRAVRARIATAAGRPAETRAPRSKRWPSGRIDCPQLCPRYTARVIQGVKVGPSPAWIKRAPGDRGHRRDQ